jgi:phosphonatase-like hydrolase
METRLIVCDIAGTTVSDRDFVAASFLGAFLREGLKVDAEEVRPLMGIRKSEAIATVLRSRSISFDEAVVARIHDDFVDSMVLFYADSPDIQPLPDVEEFLSDCRDRGVIVALNTGFPRRIADVILDRMGWLDNGWVTDSIASDEVSEGRPSPEMIHTLMARQGFLDPSTVMKVGDTVVDIQEGRHADCGMVVGVTTGSCSREELLAQKPDHVIDRFAEINGILWG